MKYTKKEIGESLKRELCKEYNVDRISDWADGIKYNREKEVSQEINNILYSIMMMNAGPEFEFTLEELKALADKLISEGEKEELGTPCPEINEIAQSLGDNWLLCPICQEYWESFSKYGMVRCPKCKNIMHNPHYKHID